MCFIRMNSTGMYYIIIGNKATRFMVATPPWHDDILQFLEDGLYIR